MIVHLSLALGFQPTPMALCTKSKVLGFFSVGTVFWVLGFYDFPFPYWPDDLVTRFSNASLIILSLGLASKSGMVSLNKEATDIFEVGMAVFGMLSFGLTGLEKSFDCGAWGFAYPALWLIVAYLGSITSYTSLTNTSITFVVLWMWQFLFNLTGLTAVSVFTSSCTLFGITLWLKQLPGFLRSLFKI
ncbi:predicted protein [Chaetoceros tenuissimus]|uniref:Uncharacterized protein n=1 Tax=Chaetoceros tenuissimus TaxID=426638 RepID=A0AAD3CJM3_9STRA|nr:predicted protein [Chaetoceros tenuissimus]